MRREAIEREYLSQPVRSLQYMLRRLSGVYPVLPEIVPDGVFGERTLEAVMLFQREFGLPVTGVVDRATWDAIRRRWVEAEERLIPARAVRIFPENAVRPGEDGESMIVPQTMFRVLSRHLDGIVPDAADGRHSPDSEENILWLQRAAGLPRTGELDARTWNALSRLYEVFVTAGDGAGEPRYTGGWG